MLYQPSLPISLSIDSLREDIRKLYGLSNCTFCNSSNVSGNENAG